MTPKKLIRAAAAALLGLAVSGGAQAQETKTAVFAGGCFWCVEKAFDVIDGVVDHKAGFAGGHVKNPTYEEVTAGGTGHREVVQVTYNPDKVTYGRLLEVFWRNVDPLDEGGQFCDRGHSYTTAIFVNSKKQRRLAEQSKTALQESGRFDQPIVTPILELKQFYPAKKSHQDYFKKNSLRYGFYVRGCGRYGRLAELWGDEARPGQDK